MFERYHKEQKFKEKIFELGLNVDVAHAILRYDYAKIRFKLDTKQITVENVLEILKVAEDLSCVLASDINFWLEFF